jgi:hypothetical protein
MRAAFPYGLQCRSDSACTAWALAANHLSTPALLLPGAGGEAAHAGSISVAIKISNALSLRGTR